MGDMFSGGLARNSRSAMKDLAAVKIGKSRKGFAIKESESASSAKLTISTRERADFYKREGR